MIFFGAGRSGAGNLDGVTSVFIQHATDLSGENQTTFIPATVSDGQIIPLVIVRTA